MAHGAAIGAVVLAAGASTRMGGHHKLRLPLHDGRTVLEHSVEQAAQWRPAQLVVVIQPDMRDLQAALTGAHPSADVVVNAAYANGMSSSLRAGIDALRDDIEAALVLLGDQPLVDPAIIEALMVSYNSDKRAVTIPVYGDVIGPPTLFRREVFPELLALTGDEGARSVVRRDPSRVSKVRLPAEAMPADIDTPEDYRRYLSQGRA